MCSVSIAVIESIQTIQDVTVSIGGNRISTSDSVALNDTNNELSGCVQKSFNDSESSSDDIPLSIRNISFKTKYFCSAAVGCLE